MDEQNGSLLDIIVAIVALLVFSFFRVAIYKWRSLRRWKIRQLLPTIRQALTEYEQLTDFQYYFYNRQEKQYFDSNQTIRRKIPINYASIGLSKLEISHIFMVVQIILCAGKHSR